MLLRRLRLIDGTGAVHEKVDVRIRAGRFHEDAVQVGVFAVSNALNMRDPCIAAKF